MLEKIGTPGNESLSRPQYTTIANVKKLLEINGDPIIADRLLKVGGTMDLDDYHWTFAGSRSMKAVRHRYMTPEQEEAKQVKMVVDTFINGIKRWEVLVENRIYRKLADVYAE